MSDFKIDDHAVEVAMRYMQAYHPEKATPEYCRAMLEYMKTALHQIARNNPDDIEAIYEEYEKYLQADDKR